MNERRKTFVMVDGEAINGVYCLLGTEKTELYNPAGISTQAALDFVIEQKTRWTNLIAYGIGYDVNMWLKDLNATQLTQLAKTQATSYGVEGKRYRIEYIPSKKFIVTPYRAVTDPVGLFKTWEKIRPGVIVFDIFGFFQKSFVAAVEAAGIATPAELAFLKRMKDKRAGFSVAELAEVRAYNKLECRFGSQLMNGLKEALNAIELHPTSYYGAGSIATALLQKFHVERYLPQIPAAMVEPVMCSYYGGRIELLKVGKFEKYFSYDVNSAYPYALSELPDLTQAHWKRASGKIIKTWPRLALGFYHVRWNIPDCKFPPFPLRILGGTIVFPGAGEGWYTNYEVEAAREVYGHDIVIIEAIVATGYDPDTRPFKWVRDLYDYRKELEAQGKHLEAKMIKYGLNSLYGKFSQGLSNHGQPKYQNFIIASLVTSQPRAAIFRLAARDHTQVISIATDAIYSKKRLTWIETGTGIGEIKEKRGEDLFIIQPGLFQAKQGGKVRQKSRGFYGGEIDFSRVCEAFEWYGTLMQVPVKCTRFVGFANALNRGDLGQWRQWVDEIREVNIFTTKNEGYIKRKNYLEMIPISADTSKTWRAVPYVPKGGEAPQMAQEQQISYMSDHDQPDFPV